RLAGGRNVMLATGGAAEPPSRRNRHIRWIFSTSLTEVEICELATRKVELDSKNPRLMIVGRQDGAKGTDNLIKALARIHRQHPGAVLEIVGDGSNLPALKGLSRELGLNDKVIFHGRVDHTEVLNLMGKAHLF